MEATEPQMIALVALVHEAAATARDGVLWSLASTDLNINLVRFARGDGVEPHVNDEVDVLGVVVAGAGTLLLDGREEALRPGVAFFVPKGARRALQATASELVYLTCHRRRPALMPTRRQR
jgi:quercetin dioxygenase-like cupin family protein